MPPGCGMFLQGNGLWGEGSGTPSCSLTTWLTPPRCRKA